MATLVLSSASAEEKKEVAAEKKEKRGLFDLGYGGHGAGFDLGGHGGLELSAGFGGHGGDLGGHGLALAGGHGGFGGGFDGGFGGGLDGHGHVKHITLHKEVSTHHSPSLLLGVQISCRRIL